jgi:phosphoglycerate-specific signal transduction histidine kinase
LILVLIADEMSDFIQFAHHVIEQHFHFLFGALDALNALAHKLSQRCKHLWQLLARQRRSKSCIQCIHLNQQVGIASQLRKQSRKHRAHAFITSNGFARLSR